MPPKAKHTQDDIRRAAFRMVREGGIGSLNARDLAREVGCSTQPIFRVYTSMEEIKREMLRMAMDAYVGYIGRSASLAPIPYLGTGLAYILFAKEEPELFKLLFMRDRVSDGTLNEQNDDSLDYVIGLVMKNTGLNREQALGFHQHLWIYVHGLAAMTATKFIALEQEETTALLKVEYQAMRKQYGLPSTAEPAPAQRIDELSPESKGI